MRAEFANLNHCAVLFLSRANCQLVLVPYYNTVKTYGHCNIYLAFYANFKCHDYFANYITEANHF